MEIKPLILPLLVLAIVITATGIDMYKEYTKNYVTKPQCLYETCPTSFNPELGETCPDPLCVAWIDINIKKGYENLTGG